MKLALHACCAPCGAAIIRELHDADADFTVMFCNPNIHPIEEYERRKAELVRYCEKQGVAWVSLDGGEDEWFARTKGLEAEPERGTRCAVCFTLRFERVAKWCLENGHDAFTTTLMTSRWKDLEQICACGHEVARRHPPLVFWDKNWRKEGRAERATQISKEENFYRQTFCGCVFSQREKD